MAVKEILRPMSNDRQNPYLTMITCTRNDDYGGSMLRRLQFTIEILRQQMSEYQIESELIIVEWNPVEGRPRLSEALQFPPDSDYLSIRVIEVPNEVHRRYIGAESHPMHVAVAFNAGLYRARGRFSVIRMSDVIWSKNLVAEITKKDLQPKTKYRCTRVDVSPDVLDVTTDIGIEEVERHCERHILMVMKKMKYYVRGLPPLRLNSDGDFQMMETGLFREMRGYLETEDVASMNVDGLLEHCAYAAGIADEPWEHIRLYKIDHGRSYKNRVLPTVIPFYKYIERMVPSMMVSPAVIKYARMFQLTRFFYDKKKMVTRGIDAPTREDYFEQCRRIVNGEDDFILNPEDWGLNKERLKETCIMRALWDV